MFRFILTLVLGFAFGWVLIASQAISWFRIQEMFHFDSFHMFGLLFSAIGTAAIGLAVIKKFKVKSVRGNEIVVTPKPVEWKANALGGLFFGMGWGLSGACSAPLYILIGIHWKIGLALFVGAMAGVYLYAFTEKKLPR